jgi:hypothetical protein
VSVTLEDEEDVSPADELVLLRPDAGVPPVAGHLAVGDGHELLALALVLADEDHERRLALLGERRVPPPPVQEGVVRAGFELFSCLAARRFGSLCTHARDVLMWALRSSWNKS